jgi:16S rRNA A1518/A1519 N6-dimethyltransferase RsmA/KsgA/DIM1 with predicted DNA glycosylase/AP lyase activity
LAPGEQVAFVRLVKRAFSQRRKMMLKLLKQDYPVDRLEPAFSKIGLDLQARAETVSLDQFVRLVKILQEGKAA